MRADDDDDDDEFYHDIDDDEDDENDVEYHPLSTCIAQLWYSLLLDPDVREFWEGQLRSCLAKDWVNSSAPFRVLDIETQSAIRHCWQSWLGVDWSVKALFESRDAFVKSHPNPAVRNADPATTVKAYMERMQARFGKYLRRSTASRTACEAERHVATNSYFTDDVPRSSLVVNPTMLLVRADGSAYFAVDPTLFPFESVDIYLDEEELAATVLDEIDCVVQTFDSDLVKDSNNTITFAASHAVTLMEELAADPTKRFDVIDTANLQDSVGLLSLLVHGSVLLKPGNYPSKQSLILTYTTRMDRVSDSRNEYLPIAQTAVACQMANRLMEFMCTILKLAAVSHLIFFELNREIVALLIPNRFVLLPPVGPGSDTTPAAEFLFGRSDYGSHDGLFDPSMDDLFRELARSMRTKSGRISQVTVRFDTRKDFLLMANMMGTQFAPDFDVPDEEQRFVPNVYKEINMYLPSSLPPLYDGKVRPPLSCLARIVDERADLDDDDEEELDVLVCGCGDLRDVEQMLSDAQSNDSHRPIHFLLNDIRPEVLARKLLILHAISEFFDRDEWEDEDEDLLAIRVGQLWYSFLLKPDVRAFWEGQIRRCLTRNWVNRSTTIRVLNLETQRAIRHCWQSWLGIDWSVETLFEKRQAFMQSHPDPAIRDADPVAAINAYMQRKKNSFGHYLSPSRAGRVTCQAERHATTETYLADGAPRSSLVVNPTMLLVRTDGSIYYAVDPELFPFNSVDIYIDEVDLGPDFAIEIQGFLTILGTAFGPDSSQLSSITFAAGHAQKALIVRKESRVTLLLDRILAPAHEHLGLIRPRVHPGRFNEAHLESTRMGMAMGRVLDLNPRVPHSGPFKEASLIMGSLRMVFELFNQVPLVFVTCEDDTVALLISSRYFTVLPAGPAVCNLLNTVTKEIETTKSFSGAGAIDFDSRRNFDLFSEAVGMWVRPNAQFPERDKRFSDAVYATMHQFLHRVFLHPLFPRTPQVSFH
ncbi:translational activator for mitochondrial COX1 [Blastocladiella emersonii ATCC 22665]|nr:translational activator for mitochondrial COX1 [Blastocladiella emersonii ATCC 22665]